MQEQAKEYRNREEILIDVNRSYEELRAYEAALAEKPYRPAIGYIGSSVFTTRVFLRAIPEGVQRYDYNEIACRNLLQAINAHFFTSIHKQIEAVLALICKVKRVEVKSHKRKELEALVTELPKEVTAQQKKAILRLAPNHPEFGDYLETAFKCFELDKSWVTSHRKGLEAISVLRNKNAHSAPELREADIDKLANLGLKRFIVDHKILLTPRLYVPICEFALNFLSELEQKMSLSELGEAIFSD